MLKEITTLGKALNKADQKTVNGGKAPLCPHPLRATYDPITRTWSCR